MLIVPKDLPLGFLIWRWKAKGSRRRSGGHKGQSSTRERKGRNDDNQKDQRGEGEGDGEETLNSRRAGSEIKACAPIEKGTVARPTKSGSEGDPLRSHKTRWIPKALQSRAGSRTPRPPRETGARRTFREISVKIAVKAWWKHKTNKTEIILFHFVTNSTRIDLIELNIFLKTKSNAANFKKL